MYDGQMYSPPRLALSFLQSAVQAGAEAANYVEVTNFLQSKSRISGVQVKDMLSGEEFGIRARVVLNTAGPWAEQLLRRHMGITLQPEGTYSRDACFVVARRLENDYALAILGRTGDPDALFSRQRRHLFIVPWRNYTLAGVWHVVHKGAPEDFTIHEKDLQSFIDEINEAYPALDLTLGDVSMWNAGLVLFGENKPGATNLSYGKRSRLVDHAKEHGLDGLITLIGVRYTTARGEAAKAIDIVSGKLGKNAPKPSTAKIPIYGGQVEHLGKFLHQAIMQRSPTLSVETMKALVHNHGSEYKAVLKYIEEDPTHAETIGESVAIKAEVLHAVREEMAQKLEDVVFRRTDLGAGGHPGATALQVCADLMTLELEWNESRRQRELEELQVAFPRFSEVREAKNLGNQEQSTFSREARVL